MGWGLWGDLLMRCSDFMYRVRIQTTTGLNAEVNWKPNAAGWRSGKHYKMFN
jgi:hypothetical protein